MSLGIILLLLIMLFFILLGFPVAFSIGLASLYNFISEGIYLEAYISRMLGSLNSFSYLAVPYFIFMGQVMNKSGLTDKIFDFAESLVGWMRGGLAQVNIVVSMIFAGISGAALADAAGIGTVLIKAMEKRGYDKDFCVVVTASSATVGPIIPPSIILVIIGITGGYSIGGLLIGGLIPGVLLGIILMIATYIFSIRKNYPAGEKSSFKKIASTFFPAIPAFVAPIIIVGGILGGIFTATEAGAVAAVYVVLIEILFYRNLDINDFLLAIKETSKVTAIILLLLSFAHVYGWLLSYHRVPNMVAEMLINFTQNEQLLLIFFAIFYLLLGTIMESAAIVVMSLPVFGPALVGLGIDPLHLGVIAGLTLSVGTITPPLGTVMYVVCDISDLKIEDYLKAIFPYLILLVGFILLIIFVPDLVLFLPRYFGIF